ncbi:hypothetical protein C8J57DRAFT_1518764 [Mycena rebaudengoi]|nr:hypothetical protein C8J57DRAFT_1518764 [Mycena rebaudengoi]
MPAYLQEIIYAIVDELRGDHYSLKACSLAAPPFVTPTRRHLFKALKLSSDAEIQCRRNSLSPRVAPFVRELVIHFGIAIAPARDAPSSALPPASICASGAEAPKPLFLLQSLCKQSRIARRLPPSRAAPPRCYPSSHLRVLGDLIFAQLLTIAAQTLETLWVYRNRFPDLPALPAL